MVFGRKLVMIMRHKEKLVVWGVREVAFSSSIIPIITRN